MAYVLGFFAADGNMIRGKRGNHYISFYSCDREIIEKIRRVMGSEHKIYCKKSRKENHKNCYQIQIGSKKIFNDLILLGLTPDKSLTLKFPKIPDCYLADFIRGYFDGDGHVSTGFYTRYDRPVEAAKKHILFAGFTSGSRIFLESLHAVLHYEGIVRGGTLYFLKGYRLSFSSQDSLRLYNFLYKDLKNSLYLPRKKKVFEKFMAMRA